MYCRKCGKELEDKWKVCPYCGEAVNAGVSAAETSGTIKTVKFYRKWSFWIAVVLVCIIAVFLLSNIMGQDKNTADDKDMKENIVQTEETEEKTTKPVTDFSDQDFSSLLGKSESDIEEIGLTQNGDTGEYSALEGDLLVKVAEGQIQEMVIKGDEKTAPAFGTVKLGSSGDEAKAKLAVEYPEAQEITDGFKLLNLDSKGSVECALTDNKISQIRFVRLSDEEITTYKAAKEEQLRAEYIFPDSDKKYLSEDEIRAKTVDEMFIGRNEIFARHGYIFLDENLKNHFEGTSWYAGTVPAEQFNSDQVFNEFEKKNVELIQHVEDEINGTTQSETEDSQAQEVADEALNFVVGKQFHLQDAQLAIEFTDAGEFIAIGYYGSDPVQNKYCTYSFSARYEYHKDAYQYLVYLTIDGVEYYFRYFTNGNITHDGYGEFSGWYQPL